MTTLKAITVIQDRAQSRQTDAHKQTQSQENRATESRESFHLPSMGIVDYVGFKDKKSHHLQQYK